MLFEVQLAGAVVVSSVKVIAALAGNPVPDAVVVPPTFPLVGSSERFASTVNDVGALTDPLDATMVCRPLSTAGIMTGQEKLPVEFELQDGECEITE